MAAAVHRSEMAIAYLTDRGAMSYDPGNEEINRMVGDLRLRDAICPLESYETQTRARARLALAGEHQGCGKADLDHDVCDRRAIPNLECQRRLRFSRL